MKQAIWMVLILLAWVGPARAWSEDGHRVVCAIVLHIGTLRHPNASAAGKAQALEFLGHFIGDIHQPLHARHAEDRGGNAIRVRFLGEETSLHEVWDGGLIAGMGLNWQTLAEKFGI